MGKEYTGQLQLASKGYLYQDRIPDGMVNVNAWGIPQERILIAPSIGFTETVSRLIKQLTDCPILPGELLLVDRWHLFIYMRCLSCGGDYAFTYKCAECNAKQRYRMDLEKDLEVKYIDDESMLAELGVASIDEPFELKFPGNGHTIKWRMLRGDDEVAVEKYVNQMKQRSQRSLPKGEDPGFTYRLARRIVEIDGVEPTISDSLAFIELLVGKDTLALRQAISAIDIGIAQEIRPVCEECGWENEVDLPLDKTFFRPERRVV